METDGYRRLSDEEIVHRVLGGRRDLFELLVQRYQRKIVHYLCRMVQDYDLAEDLAQISFVKAYTALATFDARYRFTTWLYRIASNVTVDHLRRRRMTVFSLDEPLETGNGQVNLQVPSTAPGPEEQLERKEIKLILSGAVDALPPAYRQLIVLRHDGDCSYEEIAHVTGLPMGTVKNKIFRARALLRKMLEERNLDLEP